jgi:stage IV sporulation protein FB
VFQEPSETPFDLRWRMFGVHVRVHPFFWLMTLILGWGATGLGRGDMRSGLAYLALWVLCVFVSILIHEFGHIIMGRLFGSRGHIVLHSFGGLAIGSNSLPRRWQRFLVSFAGPLAQFVLLGLALLNLFYLLPSVPKQWHDQFRYFLSFMIMINLFWPVLNLLPVWPLDGGQMAREVFGAVLGERGVSVSLVVSASLAGVLAVHCVLAEYDHPLIPILDRIGVGGIYLALLFGYLAVSNFLALQHQFARRRSYDYDDHNKFPWER